MAFIPVSKADLDDKRWLDQQIVTLRDGIDAARDIWLNWSAGREVSRFVDHGEYGRFIRETLGYDLDLKDAIALMPGASTRQIAAVAGVGPNVVQRAKQVYRSGTPAAEAPVTVLGSDGKTYPAKRVEVMVPTPAATPTGPAGRKIRRLQSLNGTFAGKMTKVEVRDQVKIMRHSMSILMPDKAVPTAHGEVFDLITDVEVWIAQWKAVQPKP